MLFHHRSFVVRLNSETLAIRTAELELRLKIRSRSSV